jgi:fluoride ion exporter CrcB/FEX
VAFPGFLAVGVGAAVGAWLRWWLGLLLNPVFPLLLREQFGWAGIVVLAHLQGSVLMALAGMGIMRAFAG